MYTCTSAHPQRTSSRGKARVSDKSRRTFVRAVAGRLPCRGEDLRAEVGEEVRVGVGVRVGPVEFKLYRACIV